MSDFRVRGAIDQIGIIYFFLSYIYHKTKTSWFGEVKKSSPPSKMEHVGRGWSELRSHVGF